MFIALLSLNLTHPGRILQGEDAKFQKLTRAQKKQRKMDKKICKRQEIKEGWRSSGDGPEENVPLHSPLPQEPNEDRGRYYGV